MRAVLLFTLAAAVAISGAWWVAGLPGQVSATVSGTTIEVSAPVALALLAALFVVLYVIVRLVGALFRAPRNLRRRRHAGNRRRGDAALNRALLALAGNDATAARRETDRGRRLLGDTPLTLLLSAQAARQGGRDEEAQALFQQMAARSDAKLLGLRGLLSQAIAREDWPAAKQLAEQAEAAHPGAAWLVDERRRMAVQTGAWQEALRLAPPAKGQGADPAARAAIALAAARNEADPVAAMKLSKQALDSDPALAPAAVDLAERQRVIQKDRAARETLKRAWTAAPHPDVAAAYLLPAGEDPAARLKLARELAATAPTNPESSMLVARTAFDGGDYAEARRQADAARAAGLDDRRVWVLLADVAEAEGNADGAQEALRHVADARPDPVWRCAACGAAPAAWAPVCDSCGTVGRIGWADAVGTATLPKGKPPLAIEGLV